MARKKKSGNGLGVLAAAAALVAGGYFLYGKDGAKNRKKVKSWMLKAKAEILERLEKATDGEISKEDYEEMVDKAIARYAKVKDVGAKEAAALAKELKAHWKKIHASVGSPKKSSAKRKTRSGKSTTARKTAKKKA